MTPYYKGRPFIPPDDSGNGYIYVLESATILKLGFSYNPVARIWGQRLIGQKQEKETVTNILVSELIPSAAIVERVIHRAAFHACRFEYEKRSELYFRDMLPFFRRAIELAEAGDCGVFAEAVEHIGFAAKNLSDGKMNRFKELLRFVA